MRILAHLLVIHAAVRCGAVVCGDNDQGCLERGCSAWCSKWTCDQGSCVGCGPETGCPDKPPPPPLPPPLPNLPPWKHTPGFLDVYGHNGALYANGKQLHLKGVNWFGSENRAGPPLGLDKHTIAWCAPGSPLRAMGPMDGCSRPL